VLPAAGGAVYRISVALPSSYDSTTNRYPVLYALDANAGFALLAQTYRLLRVDTATPELLLIGIGYEGAPEQRRAQRLADLTPTRLADQPGTGGSAEFLAFVADVLVPYVDATYRTVVGDRAIHGHSLGGLFALYALLHRPEVFQRYIATSPSLWWDDAVVFAHEARLAESDSPPTGSVFLSVGSREPEDMRAHFAPFFDRLRSREYPGLSVDAEVLPDEDHLSVFGRSFIRGLRSVYHVAAPVPTP
jgi:hypothetical protein